MKVAVEAGSRAARRRVHTRKQARRRRGGEYAGDGYVEGEYSEGGYAEGEYVEGAYAEGECAEGEYSEAEYAKGEYVEGKYAEGVKMASASPCVPALPNRFCIFCIKTPLKFCKPNRGIL